MVLQVADLNGGAVKTLDTAPIGGGSGGFLHPAISGDRVAWLRLDQIGEHQVHWQLKTQRISDASATVVAEEDLDIGGPLGLLSTPAIDVSGDLLVYSADLNLYALNLNTGTKVTIASITGGNYKPAQSPTTDGRYVFWQDYRASGSVAAMIDQLQATTLRSDLMGYDLQSGTEFPVQAGGGYNVDPELRNGVLVWEHHQTLATDPTIYMAAAQHDRAWDLFPGNEP